MKNYIDWQAKYVWQTFSKELKIEFTQLIEEGRDVEQYRSLFESARALPDGPEKAAIADQLFALTCDAPMRADYPYNEPSDIEGIRAARPARHFPKKSCDREKLADKLRGAWLGRICGCLLGKPCEGSRTEALVPMLKDAGNYPMHRYILTTDFDEKSCEKYGYHFHGWCMADNLNGSSPVDDDTNYTVLAQELIKQYGRDFTSHNVASIWQSRQPVTAYCTAERIAVVNLINGIRPPLSAVYENPCREWIGAQIRADYYGYINPGDPETAADMAWRDAAISHVKNGIYGEMFVAAMLAEAAVEDDIKTVIKAGLGEIPESCRLSEAVNEVLSWYEDGVPQEEAFARIHEKWDEHTDHGWCHTISNAMIVTAALLYGKGVYGRSICMAVETGFDTDCNGATVGSILGLMGGESIIEPEWTRPVGGKLATSIIGVGTASIDELVATTISHIL